MRVRYKLRDAADHISGLARNGSYIQASVWVRGGSLPSWCSYCVDPISSPGRLLVASRGKELVAREGDYLALLDTGGIDVISAEVFLTHYQAE